MDTLLTAFLSSGMDSLHQHKQSENYYKKVIGDYFVLSINHDYIDELTDINTSYSTSSLITQSADQSAMMLALEIDISPSNYFHEEIDKTSKAILCSPYQSFLQHQMNHKIISKRVSTSYFLPNFCCLVLGSVRKSKHLYTNPHKCCEEKTMFEKVEQLCTCQDSIELEEGVQCVTHHIYISNLIKTARYCSWTQTNLNEKPQKPSACFGNPIFELNVDSIDLSASMDSIEIDFSTEYQSLVYDDNVTRSLQGLSFSFNDGYTDSDEDSLVYETSDDDDDDDDYYDFTSFAKISSEINVLDIDENMDKRKISRYHRDCVLPKKDVNYSYDFQTKQVKTNSSKQVRFAGKTTVYPLVVWNYAYNKSRKGHWVKIANDRAHFQRRVHNVSKVLDPVIRAKLDSIKKEMEEL